MTCTFQPCITTEPEYILKMRESESERSDIGEEESDLIHLSVRQGHWFEMLTQARSAPIWWGFWPSFYQIAQCGDERSGEAEGVRVSSLLQTCVNIVGDQRAGPRTCRSYLREKQQKMGSLSIHVLRFTQCSGLGGGGGGGGGVGGGYANTAQRRGIHQLLMKERTKAGRNKRLHG